MINNYCFEEWRPIDMAKFRTSVQYYVSTYGRVKNDKGHIMKPMMINSGYLIYMLAAGHHTIKNYTAHRLVMLVFNYIEGCENLDVNHIDGNKLNNHISNLEWCTRTENMLHAYKTGLCGYGDNSANNKIDSEQAEKICMLLDHGIRQKDIRMHLDMDSKPGKGAVGNIYNGVSWPDQTLKYSFLWDTINKKLSQDQINRVIYLYMTTDMDEVAILKDIGIEYDSMDNNNKRIYRQLIKKIEYDLIH